MSKDTEFRAAAAAFSMYGGLFRCIKDEFGMEKALAFHARQGKRAGAGLAEFTRMRLGSDRELEMGAFGLAVKAFSATLGFEQTMEQSEEAVACTCVRCPLYEGYRDAGIDHDTIREMCRGMSDGMAAALRSVYPNLWSRIEFRDTPTSPCLERFVKVW